jgi:hypothetical protein
MALQLAAVAIVSLMAHLENNAVLWLIAGGMAVFTGFYWFDTFVTNLGLAFGICFLVYGLTCFSIAFRKMFERFRRGDE